MGMMTERWEPYRLEITTHADEFTQYLCRDETGRVWTEAGARRLSPEEARRIRESGNVMPLVVVGGRFAGPRPWWARLVGRIIGKHASRR